MNTETNPEEYKMTMRMYYDFLRWFILEMAYRLCPKNY